MARKKKILIIDDNPQCYCQFIEILENHYDVSAVITLTKAEWLLKRYHYDLVILDIMMSIDGHNPEKYDEFTAGFDFYCNHIRELYPNLIIVFWSALHSETIFDLIDKIGGKPTNVHIVDKYSYHLEEFEDFILSILPPK